MLFYVPFYNNFSQCRTKVETLGVFENYNDALRALIKKMIKENHFHRESKFVALHFREVCEQNKHLNDQEYEDYLYDNVMTDYDSDDEANDVIITDPDVLIEKLRDLGDTWDKYFLEYCEIGITKHQMNTF